MVQVAHNSSPINFSYGGGHKSAFNGSNSQLSCGRAVLLLGFVLVVIRLFMFGDTGESPLVLLDRIENTSIRGGSNSDHDSFATGKAGKDRSSDSASGDSNKAANPIINDQPTQDELERDGQVEGLAFMDSIEDQDQDIVDGDAEGGVDADSEVDDKSEDGSDKDTGKSDDQSNKVIPADEVTPGDASEDAVEGLEFLKAKSDPDSGEPETDETV